MPPMLLQGSGRLRRQRREYYALALLGASAVQVPAFIIHSDRPRDNPLLEPTPHATWSHTCDVLAVCCPAVPSTRTQSRRTIITTGESRFLHRRTTGFLTHMVGTHGWRPVMVRQILWRRLVPRRQDSRCGWRIRVHLLRWWWRWVDLRMQWRRILFDARGSRIRCLRISGRCRVERLGRISCVVIHCARHLRGGRHARVSPRRMGRRRRIWPFVVVVVVFATW
jgi:hypothetical protein